jgi:hypothetical protein
MANYSDVGADMIASFRGRMKAFSNSTTWPDDIVEQALYEADTETGGSRWGSYEDKPRNTKQRGMFYFAAHWLASTYLTQSAEDEGNISASARLNVASKSVGDESLAYRVGSIQDTGDDWLSLTNYGVQFYRLRKNLIGAMVV